MNLNVKLKRVSDFAQLPTKGTKGSAYYDLYSVEDVWLGPCEVVVISTGWNIEVPEGYFLDLRPRSGMSLEGVTIVNAPGTVDADYRGELKIILARIAEVGDDPYYHICVGDRVAQCALLPVVECGFEEVACLSETERGANGYGSTGL